jgi:hypothetical protein
VVQRSTSKTVYLEANKRLAHTYICTCAYIYSIYIYSICIYIIHPAHADKSEGDSRGAGGFGKLAGFGAWVGDHAVERRRCDALVERFGACQGAGVHPKWVIGREKNGLTAEQT